MNSYFKFKQFTINQEHCAMKVGTDGVLLGAWGAVGDGRILDIGCGTGLISIMAAQRTVNSIIEGVEIDSLAAQQAASNVVQSSWGDRVAIHNCDIINFQPNYRYDYILSNPPYFVDSLKSPHQGRTIARHSDTLPYDILSSSVSRLLSDSGIFSIILPYVEANLFIVEGVKHNLFCFKRMDIRGTSNKGIKRVMLQFAKDKREFQTEELIIETAQRGIYTQKYRELTKEFYLKF